ncbi:DUF6946 family protein [Metaclostridioides mangenotii]|uniref:DUF6946 domain-containing protein n=1 Tax=Metaclostridioides mangenotii TaxID=1540 RepID=A0ABS4E7Y2_9FIRM|nr:hypothetical protein [Clostridioides mangenotii]MBP1854052.1 hypothetical protein [Clostridioides mangenotii]
MGIYKLKLQKKDCNIDSLKDWRNLAPPKKVDTHWKDGRSAKEVAKYILAGNGYIPKEIEEILSEIGCNKEKIFYGEPEAVTKFVGRGEGCNHDILFIQDSQAVISIEAKTDEELGKLVSKELENISENKLIRIKS